MMLKSIFRRRGDAFFVIVGFFFWFWTMLSRWDLEDGDYGKVMAKRLIPLLNRVLVEKITPPSKTTAGILLPEKTSKGGQTCSVSVKEGETVLLPEYGGTEVKLGEKEYHLYRDEDILGTLHD
ncbi:hypothetical protein DH2020_041060 [Rehmannia glutinosa]|uniref:Uncharacterized protein n=1 Tax=Rehmannia glutinosa TaxID=99300 RepID=A0ABR0UR94_REHGL